MCVWLRLITVSSFHNMAILNYLAAKFNRELLKFSNLGHVQANSMSQQEWRKQINVTVLG